MINLKNKLQKSGVITADGAIGTRLQQLGFGNETCLEALNLNQQDIVGRIVLSYLEADAEILQTNTFGASPIRLSMFGLEAETEKINDAAVALVREVAGDNIWITGSCGPCGRCLQPFGDLDPEEFKESCERQIGALVKGGLDAVSIETMMDVEEAALAIQVAKKISPDTVVMASATFNETPQGFRTPFGTSVEEVATRFADESADVIGANCSVGMEKMIKIARELREATSLPLLIRPNAGLPVMRDGEPVWLETPADFAAGARELLGIGVNIIGGCCGTTPEHIRYVRRVVDEWIKG